MDIRKYFYWFYQSLSNYNLFIPEPDDYDDDEDDSNERRNPETVLERQKHSTRLYTILFFVSLYILFYIGLTEREVRQIQVTLIDSLHHNKLKDVHGDKLSCPCTKTTIALEDFITSTITHHPVCTSEFVSNQWIEALHTTVASKHGVADFRSTASHQFRLLADLCKMSKETIEKYRNDLNKSEIVSFSLITETDLKKQIDSIAETLKTSEIGPINAFINYLRMHMRSNYLVSALNTNLIVVAEDRGQLYRIRARPIALRRYDANRELSISACNDENPHGTTIFGGTIDQDGFEAHLVWQFDGNGPGPIVKEFYSACTPLEAILASTLGCLYQMDCLLLLETHFPKISEFKIDLNASLLLSKPLNSSVENLLLKLFIDQEQTLANYPKYFSQCSPLYCTYAKTNELNVLRALTLLISLYGSLIIVLRFISPSLIDFCFELRKIQTNRNISQDDNRERKLSSWLKKSWMKFIRSMKRLNLFKDISQRTEDAIRQQKIITRTYLVLLLGSILLFTLYTWFRLETVTVTVPEPSFELYQKLQILHQDAIECSCPSITIPYDRFVSISPEFHQICTSDLLNKHWISVLEKVKHPMVDGQLDWRNRASSHFKLLSDICELARKTVDDSVKRFRFESLISANLIHEEQFLLQMNSTLEQFFRSNNASFNILSQLIPFLLQIDQPFMGEATGHDSMFVPNLIVAIVPNSTNNRRSIKLNFNMSGTHDINTTLINCICDTNPYCQSPAAIYPIDFSLQLPYDPNHISIIPGLTERCFKLDSLLLSTLECFYLESFCFQLLISQIIDVLNIMLIPAPWYNVRPLIYDSTSTRYPMNTSLKIIFENMMIEQWNSSYSYEKYYRSCSPTHCTYSQITNRKTLLRIILDLVSLLGGLTVSLRLIVPHLVQFIGRRFRSKAQRQIQEREQQQRRQQQQVHVSYYIHLRTFLRNTTFLLYTKIIELNLFQQRDLGGHRNPESYQKLGRWASRLYILCLLCSFFLLSIYRVVKPVTLTKTFSRLHFQRYQSLKDKYGDSLICNCQSFATPYDQFLRIEPKFHQICEWRNNMTPSIAPDLFMYSKRDYRHYFVSHLQYLQLLCHFSMKIVDDDQVQLLYRPLITKNLLSEKDFTNRFNIFLEQHQSNLPILFNRLLTLVLNFYHGNAFMSRYGTNYQYIAVWPRVYQPTYAYTEAEHYDDECSCGLSRYCTSDAYLLEKNSSQKTFIEGMKIGCTPSESFHQSTFQCFYHSSCLHLLLGNSTSSPDRAESRYSIDTTIDELRENLFLENWSSSLNYSAYFHYCSPSVCSYTFIEQFNLIYLITYFISLFGGLTIVFKWVCPKLVRIIAHLYQYRKRNNSLIHPVPSNTTTNNQSAELIATNSRTTPKMHLTIILSVLILISILTSLIFFSIKMEIGGHLTTNTKTTTVSNIDSQSTATKNLTLCHTRFDMIYKHMRFNMENLIVLSLAVVHFNNDDYVDLVVSVRPVLRLKVYFGSSDGKFNDHTEIYSAATRSTHYTIFGHFNNDNYIDISYTESHTNDLVIRLGDDHISFGDADKYSLGNFVWPTALTTGHFNNDTYADIAVINYYSDHLSIFFGIGNGKFLPEKQLATNRWSFSRSIAVADINHDLIDDIIVSNSDHRTISVFISHNDGTFYDEKVSFLLTEYSPEHIIVGDLNGDNEMDIIISYQFGNRLTIGSGDGSGYFNQTNHLYLQNGSDILAIALDDLNSDSHMDILIIQHHPYTLIVLYGYSDGTFYHEKIFSTDDDVAMAWIGVEDFNKDTCRDIVVVERKTKVIRIFLNQCLCFHN